jgi:hypothetical protein
MNYFAINFGNFTSFIIKSSKVSSLKELVYELDSSVGIVGAGNMIMNPKRFISVESISSPDERQKNRAKNLSEVLF